MSKQHRNNFDLLRLVFASLVVYSHSFAFVGAPEPTVWGSSFGNLAVNGFFVISGYLISQSYLNHPKLIPFAVNRFLRIVPGLIAALVMTKFIAAWCNGFHTNPIPNITNGPIWTLTWEVVCYGVVPLVGTFGILTRASMPAFFAAGWLAYAVNIESNAPFYLVIAPLLMQFLSGALFRVMEGEINIRRIAMVSAAVLVICANVPLFLRLSFFVRSHIVFAWGADLSDQQLMRALFIAALPSVVIMIGKHLPATVPIRYDISYGIYVYGWPVGQAIVFMQGASLHPLVVFSETMAVTVVLALVSCLLVERPALLLRLRPRRAVPPARSETNAVPESAAALP